MTESAVSWTPATSATHVRRVIIPLSYRSPRCSATGSLPGMKRRDFIQTMGAAAAGGLLARSPSSAAKKLDRIGLETYAVRHATAENPERTLAAVRAIGYSDVDLRSSLNLLVSTRAK